MSASVPLEQTLNLAPDDLREEIKTIWKDRTEYRYLTYGAILRRIKREKLYKPWGYRSYQTYLREELGMTVPSFVNLWTGAANSLLERFTYKLQDLEWIEKKVPQSLLFASVAHTDNKNQLEALWEKCNYRPIQYGGLRRSFLLSEATRIEAKWPSSTIYFTGRAVRLVEEVIGLIQSTYNIQKRGRAILVMALVYRGLVEAGVEGLEHWLGVQARYFELPEGIAKLPYPFEPHGRKGSQTSEMGKALVKINFQHMSKE